MVEYMRAMLTELMKPFQVDSKSFKDPDVCKHFLVDFCPNDLFYNTKADLGTCPNVHDMALRIIYQESSERGMFDYEKRFYGYLQKLIDDLDKKIKSGKERLAMTPMSNLGQAEQEIREERKIMLENRIKDVLVEVEKAGEAGHVDTAADLMRTVEQTRSELRVVMNNEDINPTMRQEKQLEVCQICGAFVATNDTPERMAAHLAGKQHTGCLKIREALSVWKAKGGDIIRYEGSGGIPYRASGSRQSRDDRGANRYRGGEDRRGPPGPPPAAREPRRDDRRDNGYRDSRPRDDRRPSDRYTQRDDQSRKRAYSPVESRRDHSDRRDDKRTHYGDARHDRRDSRPSYPDTRYERREPREPRDDYRERSHRYAHHHNLDDVMQYEATRNDTSDKLNYG